MNSRTTSRLRPTARLLVYTGLPIAVVMAAAMIAGASKGDWMIAGQPIPAAAMKLDLDDLNKRIAALEAAANAEPDCPRGYAKAADPDPKITVCKKGPLGKEDEMVKVGKGIEAFWIDRYEASVWQNSDGTGMQYGKAGDDYVGTFPKNGQRTTPQFLDLYALSKAGVPPSASLTWFQAQQACRASGKRLPTDEEWLAAASGTPDPTMPNDGSKNGDCVTQAAGPRVTGGANLASQTHCLSAWGAQDMIGNVWEWTSQWYAGLGAANVSATWPDTANGSYNMDGTWNIASSADKGGGTVVGIPAAAIRGGNWNNRTQAGVFALDLTNAPSSWNTSLGFRCAACP